MDADSQLEAELKGLEDFGDDIADLDIADQSSGKQVEQNAGQPSQPEGQPRQSDGQQSQPDGQGEFEEDDLMDIDVEELLKEKDMEDDFSQQSGQPRSRGILRQTWINERGTPELLPYETELVDEIKRHIDEQQELIFSAKAADRDGLECNLYQIELDRIKYILSSYLRTRLGKIEKYVLYILSNEQAIERLSAHELKYAKSYLDLLESHFNASFLDSVPGKFRELTTQNAETNMVREPDLNEFAFLRVKEDLGSIEIGQQEYELKANDLVAASYSHFRELLQEEKVEII